MPNFRLTFSKDNVLVYISHLDLNHAFIRALNRAEIKLKFSEGFNPHPKIVFALPLSVGTAGENEIVDIGVDDESLSAEKFKELIEKQMPPHITIKKAEIAEKKLKDISAANYRITVHKTGICNALRDFFNSEISIVKKTKSGEKNVVISERIQSAQVSECSEKGTTEIFAVLDADSVNYLNPELVVRAMIEKGIITENDPYTTVREKIIFNE